MTFYVTYNRIFSVYIEVNAKLGHKPIFKTTKYYHETIINFPYIQIILTPRYKITKTDTKTDK